MVGAWLRECQVELQRLRGARRASPDVGERLRLGCRLNRWERARMEAVMQKSALETREGYPDR